MQELEKVNPKMITIARESRGMVHLDLAGKLQVSKATAWHWEKDFFQINANVITQLAILLQYPLSFFYQLGDIIPALYNYRKRDKVAAKLMSQIEANINISRLNMETLLPLMNFKGAELPCLDITKYGTPQACAQQLRKLWKLEKGALLNVSEVLEKHNILLLNFDFTTERVDGLITLASETHPIIITNKTLLGDRQRFTLAQQLGHLIMHKGLTVSFDRDLTHEANLFAAEFLMPEKDIQEDLHDLTLAKLGDLKKKWKVSMQALMYRANDLQIITDNQKKYLVQQFNDANIRRREPKELDVPVEQYKLVRDLITKYKSKQKLSVSGMAAFLHLEQNDFLERYSF